MEDDKNFNEYRNLSRKIPVEMEALVLSFVFSLILVSVFVVPGYKQMKIADERIKLIQKNIESKNSVLKKVKDYNEENKTIREMDLEKFNSLLLEKNNVEKYIMDINKAANAKGSRVSIREFSISNPIPVKLSVENSSLDLQVAEISFSVSGDFDNFMSFLDSIEKNVPLMELSGLNISKIKSEENGEADAKTTFVEAEVALSFYYL